MKHHLSMLNKLFIQKEKREVRKGKEIFGGFMRVHHLAIEKSYLNNNVIL